MATWWKRVVYSKWFKFLLAVGMSIAGCIFFYSMLHTGTLADENKSYVDTEEFRRLFIQKAGYLRDWIVRYDEDTIFTQITDAEIEAYIKKDGRGLSKEEARAGIVNDRNNYYNMILNELIYNNTNIDFIAIDTEKNRQLTNMGSDKSTQAIINELCSRNTCLIGNGYYILQVNYGMDNYTSYYNGHYFTDEYYYTGESFTGQDNYRIYIALKEPLEEGDQFYTSYNEFTLMQKKHQNVFKYLFSSIGMALIIMLVWVIVVGQRPEDNRIYMRAIDKVPFEIQGCLFIMSFFAFLHSMGAYDEIWGIENVFNVSKVIFDYNLLGTCIYCSIIFIYVFIILGIVSSWIRHFKNHTITQHIWCVKTAKSIYDHIFGERQLALMIMLIIVVNLLVNVIGIKIAADYAHVSIMLYSLVIIWNSVFGIMLLKFALEYKMLLKGAKEIAEGQFDRKVDLGNTVPVLTEMADTINSMGEGLEKAVAASVQSERLKTELITNVSHDLKTPLTSIISYIDLLKAEEIDNKVACEYINILDERSHRLKLLVEDLVEASKVVTGNVKAQIDTLRLDELVGQAIGEYLDRIENSGLEIIYSDVEEVYIDGDGRHMWRIVENLLSNVCKYAMPQTRVYIQVTHQDEFGCLIIKNISKDALNVKADELTERFVRGDVSRSTEGSGLGLAITQSLVTLQKGELDIHIDGDLFKVEIRMPKHEVKEDNIGE